MSTSSDTNVKICKGLLVVKTESGPILEKVLVETKRDPTTKNVKCRLYRIPPDFLDQSHQKRLHKDSSCCTRCDASLKSPALYLSPADRGESSEDIEDIEQAASLVEEELVEIPPPLEDNIRKEKIAPRKAEPIPIIKLQDESVPAKTSMLMGDRSGFVVPPEDDAPPKKRQIKSVQTLPGSTRTRRMTTAPKEPKELTVSDQDLLPKSGDKSMADLSVHTADDSLTSPANDQSSTSYADIYEDDSSSSDFELDETSEGEQSVVTFIDSKLRRLRSQQSKLYLTNVRYKTHRQIPDDIGNDPEPVLRRLSSSELSRGKQMSKKKKKKEMGALKKMFSSLTILKDDAQKPEIVGDEAPKSGQALVAHDSALMEERTLDKLRQMEQKDYVIDLKPSVGIMKKSDDPAKKISSKDARLKPSNVTVTIKRSSMGTGKQTSTVYPSQSISELSDLETKSELPTGIGEQDGYDVISKPSDTFADEENADNELAQAQSDGEDLPISDLYKSDKFGRPQSTNETTDSGPGDVSSYTGGKRTKPKKPIASLDLTDSANASINPCRCKPCKKKKPKKSKRKPRDDVEEKVTATDISVNLAEKKTATNIQVSQTSIKTYTGSYIGVLEDDVCFCYPIEAFSPSVLDFLGEDKASMRKKCHHDNLPEEVKEQVATLRNQASTSKMPNKQRINVVEEPEIRNDNLVRLETLQKSPNIIAVDKEDNKAVVEKKSDPLLQNDGNSSGNSDGAHSVEDEIIKERKDVVKSQPMVNYKNDEMIDEAVTDPTSDLPNDESENLGLDEKESMPLSLIAVKSKVFSNSSFKSAHDVVEEGALPSEPLAVATTSGDQEALPPRKQQNYIEDICLHTYQYDDTGTRICICPRTTCPYRHKKKNKSKNQKKDS